MDAIKASIEHDKSLAFLYMVNTEQPDSNFPSWLPDFGNIGSRWNSLYGQEKEVIQFYYNPETHEWGRRCAEYEEMISVAKFEMSLESRRLHLYGRILGEVEGTPIKMPPGYSDRELLAPSWQAALDYIRTLRSILSLEPRLQGYHTGETSHEVLRKTLLCLGYVGDYTHFPEWSNRIQNRESKANPSFDTFRDLQTIEGANYSWGSELVWAFEELFSLPEGREIIESADFKVLVAILVDGQMEDHHLCTVRSLEDNAVFFCSGGYFGMGSPLVQEGDKLILVAGLQFPIVIRKVEDCWRFVGPAYVHGVTVKEFWPKDGEEMEMVTLV